MKIIPYADMLVATIQHLFPKGTPQVQGKVFATSFRIEMEHTPSPRERKPTVRGCVHLAILADRNYVKVLSATTERPCEFTDIDNWVLLCDHDSAWRDDGVRSGLKSAYQALYKEATSRFNRTEDAMLVSINVDKMAIVPRGEVFGVSLPDDVRDLVLRW